VPVGRKWEGVLGVGREDGREEGREGGREEEREGREAVIGREEGRGMGTLAAS
jgi:hypothetical protein